MYLRCRTAAGRASRSPPSRHAQAGFVYYTPAYAADSGIKYTLTSATGELMQAGNRFYDLKTGEPYNPATVSSAARLYPDRSRWHGLCHQHVAGRGSGDARGHALQINDDAVIALNGTRLSFPRDTSGRLIEAVAPDGTQVLYAYDAAGDLVSARNLALGRSSRYGYRASQPHLLDLAVYAAAGASAMVPYTPGPIALPLAADLGGSGMFLHTAQAARLPAGGPTATRSA